MVLVVAQPGQKEKVSIAYRAPLTDAQMKEDFAALTSELRTAPVQPQIDRKSPDPSLPETAAAQAEVPGLVDWSKGVLNLEPLVRPLRRFPRVQVSFLLMGRFNLTAPVGEQKRGPIRWRTQVTPMVVSYQVWSDPLPAPGGAPGGGRDRLGWPWIVGLGSGAVMLAGGVGYLIYLLRRPAQAGATDREG